MNEGKRPHVRKVAAEDHATGGKNVWEDQTIAKGDRITLFRTMHECVHARKRSLVDLLLRQKRAVISIEKAVSMIIGRSTLSREDDKILRGVAAIASTIIESLPSDTTGTVDPSQQGEALLRTEVMILLARADDAKLREVMALLSDLADAPALAPSSFRHTHSVGLGFPFEP
jgi:hypothetical protein